MFYSLCLWILHFGFSARFSLDCSPSLYKNLHSFRSNIFANMLQNNDLQNSFRTPQKPCMRLDFLTASPPSILPPISTSDIQNSLLSPPSTSISNQHDSRLLLSFSYLYPSCFLILPENHKRVPYTLPISRYYPISHVKKEISVSPISVCLLNTSFYYLSIVFFGGSAPLRRYCVGVPPPCDGIVWGFRPPATVLADQEPSADQDQDQEKRFPIAFLIFLIFFVKNHVFEKNWSQFSKKEILKFKNLNVFNKLSICLPLPTPLPHSSRLWAT